MKTKITCVAVIAAMASVGCYTALAGSCGSGANCGNEAKKDKEACSLKNGCVAGESEKKHTEIGTDHLKKLIQSNSSVVVLDARSGKWDDGERIPGAKALNEKSSAEEVAKVVPSKDALIVTYCSNTKCPASNRLADHLASLGYKNILEYPKGIQGWKEDGNEVTKN